MNQRHRSMNDRSGRTGGRAETFAGLSSLRDLLEAKHIEDAVELARSGDYLESAVRFGQSGVAPGDQEQHASELALAFYRSALAHQSKLAVPQAIGDLVTASQFPNLPRPLWSLIQQRLTAIQKDLDEEVRRFDEAVAGRFDRRASEVDLRGEFLTRYGLSRAIRSPGVAEIDEISSVGVYRWAGDTHRNEQWSQLIRKFKSGESTMPALFGRILAEHVRATPMCRAWRREVDYIVPVPAAASRTAVRGINIVVKMSEHVGSRLGVPVRTDFLKRSDDSERSRFVSKSALGLQYSFNGKKAADIQGRAVLLLDDVMNRGYTAGVCASRLKEFGCSSVVLLVLALAESSLQSGHHAQAAGD